MFVDTNDLPVANESKPPEPTPTPAPTPAPTKPAASAPTPATTPVSDPPAPKTRGYEADPLYDVPSMPDPLLVKILSWPRTHGSFQEMAFCKWLREHITSLGCKWEIMVEGNIVVTVPRPAKAGDPAVPKPSTTLFSCHVDTCDGTVAGAKGEDGVKVMHKKLTYDPIFGLIALEKDSIGGCLGADDGAGVWLMLKMIERRVPGTYVFHRGEEVGGIGSQALATKHKEFLEYFEAAVAFDRHDTYEVITHQRSQRCASDKFGEALAARLTAQGMKYETSGRGVFTDTANYQRIIPECVNVAVGYDSQHGRNETLNYAHLAALLEAVCNIDWDALPIDRDPKAAPVYSSGFGRQRSLGYQGYLGMDDDDRDWARTYARGSTSAPQQGGGKKAKKQQAKQQAAANHVTSMTVSDELSRCSLVELEGWCIDNPEDAAKAIGQLLMEIGQLQATVKTTMQLLGWEDEK